MMLCEHIMLHYQNYVTLMELSYIKCTSIHLRIMLLNGIRSCYCLHFTLYKKCVS